MVILVTGSSGHLGEAIMRVLRGRQQDVVGLDVVSGAFTDVVGSVTDQALVDDVVRGVDSIIHTATLHKPHVQTHSNQNFVDTNVSGTLNLLESAVAHGCRSLIFTSTTSTFGRALVPSAGEPAAWISEDVRPIPKNIYGVTKLSAENLCELFHFRHKLPCLVLRTSRFFPEEDDNRAVREEFDDLNVKVNELLYRRVDIEDAVSAHLLAVERAESIGFQRYIVSATSPFSHADLAQLRESPEAVVGKYVEFQREYERRGWRMPRGIDRVYVNDRARADLGWIPRYTFAHAIDRLRQDASPFSDLTDKVGSKGYHPGQSFVDGPFPV